MSLYLGKKCMQNVYLENGEVSTPSINIKQCMQNEGSYLVIIIIKK